MKIDLYTKTILTIIAACLIWLSATRSTPVAIAQAPQQPAQPTPVVLVNPNGVPVEAIRVVVSNPQPIQVAAARPIGVSVQSIERTARWDPIRVQVLRDPPTQLPTP